MEFLKKYGFDSDDIEELLENNDAKYILNFTEEDIDRVANVLKKYKITFIDDLIKADIGIFAYNSKDVELSILKMIKRLGSDYLNIINDDISIVIDSIYNKGE